MRQQAGASAPFITNQNLNAAGFSTGVRLLSGGRFWMGSNHHYLEEAPEREIEVAPFLIDASPVTNRQFAALVSATAYVTMAEIAPSASEYPEAIQLCSGPVRRYLSNRRVEYR